MTPYLSKRNPILENPILTLIWGPMAFLYPIFREIWGFLLAGKHGDPILTNQKNIPHIYFSIWGLLVSSEVYVRRNDFGISNLKF